MSSLVSTTKKQFNENGHVEYGWEDKLTGKIVQYFFQLVRTDDTTKMEKILNDILLDIKHYEFSNMKNFVHLYKLIGQTRDIIAGKGEQDLAFMQLWVWWQHYPKLAEYAFEQMVVLNGDVNSHPYGSWKDIKYWCRYVKKRSGNRDHPLIEKALTIAIVQLNRDLKIYQENSINKKKISLISRWLPREKSSFGWVFKKMALKMYGSFLDTAQSSEQTQKAKLKAYITLKKQLVRLSSFIDTPQIKMCDDRWHELEFNNVTTQTLRINRRSIMNLNKDNTTRSKKKDRKNCAENYYAHREASKVDPKRHKIHGNRANVYEFVKDAMELKRTSQYQVTEEIRDNLNDQIDSINLQWLSNKTNNRLKRRPIISIVDTSYSMEVNNRTPLYNAVGLGIRTSELTHSAFKNRILTFSAIPRWVNLDDIEDNFVKKVWRVMDSNSCMNANFYRAMTMILNVIVEEEIPPFEVEGITLAVFSAMQIDVGDLNGVKYNDMKPMFKAIEKMYVEAGLRSVFKQPYQTPHILFWNLLGTNGFPSKTSQKNVTFMSGYNSILLDNFSNKGMEVIREYTPTTVLENMLDNPRLRCLEVRLMSEFA